MSMDAQHALPVCILCRTPLVDGGCLNCTLPVGAEVAECRVCGCTELEACETAFGSCFWVEPDLCSSCARAS